MWIERASLRVLGEKALLGEPVRMVINAEIPEPPPRSVLSGSKVVAYLYARRGYKVDRIAVVEADYSGATTAVIPFSVVFNDVGDYRLFAAAKLDSIRDPRVEGDFPRGKLVARIDPSNAKQFFPDAVIGDGYFRLESRSGESVVGTIYLTPGYTSHARARISLRIPLEWALTEDKRNIRKSKLTMDAGGLGFTVDLSVGGYWIQKHLEPSVENANIECKPFLGGFVTQCSSKISGGDAPFMGLDLEFIAHTEEEPVEGKVKSEWRINSASEGTTCTRTGDYPYGVEYGETTPHGAYINGRIDFLVDGVVDIQYIELEIDPTPDQLDLPPWMINCLEQYEKLLGEAEMYRKMMQDPAMREYLERQGYFDDVLFKCNERTTDEGPYICLRYPWKALVFKDGIIKCTRQG